MGTRGCDGREERLAEASGRDRAIVDRFRAGETTTAIAAAHGLTRQRVSQILAREGVGKREGGRALASRRGRAR